MLAAPASRRPSFLILCVSLLAVFVVFGVPVTYSPALYGAIAGVQFVIICLAAWKLGAFAIRGQSEPRRMLALAGGLIVLAWALFSFLPGFGPPPSANAPENALRYLILLINALLIAGGLIVLWQALSEAGERFYSTLGFAAIMLATPPYVIFNAFSLEAYRAMQQASPLEEVPWLTFLGELSHYFLDTGVVLTYLAVAAFALALRRVTWIGPIASRILVCVCLFAVACVGARVARELAVPQDPMWSFKVWYTMPGVIFAIPAVPWIMPCFLGVVLLKRAGDEQRWA